LRELIFVSEPCPICGGELSFGYGFAGGGGIGGYQFCLDCGAMISKHVEVPGECLHGVETGPEVPDPE
jgi:hypothetical protein